VLCIKPGRDGNVGLIFFIDNKYCGRRQYEREGTIVSDKKKSAKIPMSVIVLNGI
jgi:hypothetical protein